VDEEEESKQRAGVGAILDVFPNCLQNSGLGTLGTGPGDGGVRSTVRMAVERHTPVRVGDNLAAQASLKR
jgi:hypothetical protein